ncbi:MAG: SctK family type III secretion system sorting platform protein [Hydrogenophaga sp.]
MNSGTPDAGLSLPAMDCTRDHVDLVRRLIDAFRDRSARFVRHLHPDWIQAALPGWAASLPRWCGRDNEGQLSLLLAQTYEVQWPTLQVLSGRWHRLALMPRPVSTQALAFVSLYVHRAAIRRCVDKASRQKLVNMVGAPAMAVLIRSVESDSRPVPQDLEILQADQRVAEGFRLLHRTGHWSCKRSSKLLRLTLPKDMPEPKDPAGPLVSAQELDGVFDLLSDCFPEQSWLFGSDMDRALSV